MLSKKNIGYEGDNAKKNFKGRRNCFPYRQRDIGFTNIWPKLFILRVVVTVYLIIDLLV